MPNPDVWQASTSYAAGDMVRPTTDNDFVYYALNAGTSGSSEPTWPTTQGATVTDNDITWVAIKARAAYLVLDQALNYIKTNGDQLTICTKNPTNFYQACDPDPWQASTSYSVGDVVRPTTRNGFTYKCITAGTSGSSEPTWPTTAGQTVTDGTVEWEAYENYTLCATSMSSSDYSIETSNDGGRKLSTVTKSDIPVYADGEGRFGAIVSLANKELLIVLTPTSVQTFSSGALAQVNSFSYEINLP